MERNNFFLFKPTASLCFGGKVQSSGTRMLCPSMSDGERSCFHAWVVDVRVCGTWELSESGRRRSALHGAAHVEIGKSCLARAGQYL